MTQLTKSPLDLLDTLYTLAYWMTGSESDSSDLLHKTYHDANSKTPQSELLKTFRHSYLERFGQNTDFYLTEKPCNANSQLIDSLRQWAADIKLSVLLSELSDLKHAEIAEIIGKPVDTVRLWLFWGRKILVNDRQLKVSA